MSRIEPGPLTLSFNHQTTKPNDLDVIIGQEITYIVIGDADF